MWRSWPVLFLVGIWACGNKPAPQSAEPVDPMLADAVPDEPVPAEPVPDEPVPAEPVADPPPAPQTFPLGGERSKVLPVKTLDDLLPPLGDVPVLDSEFGLDGRKEADVSDQARALNADGLALRDEKDYAAAQKKLVAALEIHPGYLEARYNLATVHVLAGQTENGLALLHELLTTWCAECDPYVIRVTGDPHWQGLIASPLLHRVIRAWSPEGEYGDADWNGAECPGNTVRKAKLDSDGNGEVWCEKRGGIKHGPYLAVEADTRGANANYKNGKLHGPSSHFESYPSSEWFQDFYIDGTPAGVSKQGHGHSYEIRYTLGFAQGSVGWVESEDGDVIERSTPTGDKTDVTLFWTIADGWRVLFRRVERRGDNPHGQWVYYHDSGHPAELLTYDSGELHGRIEYWDSDGKSLGSSTMDHGDGEWIDFDPDGTLVTKGAYVNKKKHGPWIERRGEGNYKAGRRVGQWTMKAVPYARAEGNFKNGKRDGTWTYYSEDGSVAVDGKIRAGKPQGTWKVPSDDGGEHVFVFSRSGKLLEVDGEKVLPKQWNYYPEVFIDSPGLPEEYGEW